jgi:hypothetical protein
MDDPELDPVINFEFLAIALYIPNTDSQGSNFMVIDVF